MKKAIIILSLLFFAFRADDPQKFKVENSLDYWQRRLNVLEVAKNAIKNSDIPVKTAAPLLDSLTTFENEIVAQVQTQMPKPKSTGGGNITPVDSTNKK